MKKLLCIFLIFSFIALTGCLDSGECSLPADCDDRQHKDCYGDWLCRNGVCEWRCMGSEFSEETDHNVTEPECINNTNCLAGGCNGQLCGTSFELMNLSATCEWDLRHECLKKTSCDCINGSCIWAINDEYLKCMQDYNVSESRIYCETDSDCVPAECCHPSECVNRGYMPDCFNISCDMSCETCLDCGGGECVCFMNECVVRMK